MKKLILTAAITAASTMTAQAPEYQPIVTNVYPMTAAVTALDYKNDLVTFEDANGFLWNFAGCEDWNMGDVVSLLINDSGTEKIFDDMILTVRYSGYTLSDFQ